MNDDEYAEASTQPEQVESFLLAGMRDVGEKDGVLVSEHRLRLVEGDAAFALVLARLAASHVNRRSSRSKGTYVYVRRKDSLVTSA